MVYRHKLQSRTLVCWLNSEFLPKMRIFLGLREFCSTFKLDVTFPPYCFLSHRKNMQSRTLVCWSCFFLPTSFTYPLLRHCNWKSRCPSDSSRRVAWDLEDFTFKLEVTSPLLGFLSHRRNMQSRTRVCWSCFFFAN